MRRPGSVPSWVRRTAFASRDAESVGLTPSRIRGSDVVRPFHGVSGFDVDTTSPFERVRAFEPLLLPEQSFSHTTALQLHGAPIRDDGVLHLSVDFPRTPPRGVGVVGHALRARPLAVVHGVPVSTPAAAWVESASLLGVRDLIVTGDFLVTGGRDRGIRSAAPTTREELASELERVPRRPGRARAVEALRRIREGVDSPRETALRLAIVDAGLPEPETDVAVTVRGGLVLHADLGYRSERIALEYEGDGHRTDRRTWSRDIERRELFEDEGWRVLRVTARDLERDSSFLARLADLLSARRRDLPA